MLCDNCHKSPATVHLKSLRSPTRTAAYATSEAHYCGECAAKLQQTGEFTNPSLKMGPDSIRLRLRVINVTHKFTSLRQLSPEPDEGTPDWLFLTEKLPAAYAEVGCEFEMCCSRTELDRLQGMT